MASFFSSTFLIFVTIFAAFSTSRSSTTGVEYISRLLEVQDRERAPAYVQVAAARGVLRRLLPSHLSSFDFQIVSKDKCGGESCFVIRNHRAFRKPGDPEILIAGVTGVEVLAGLHWYLKHWCGAHISWDKTGGSQLFSVPKAGLLPRIQTGEVVIRRPIPLNYYQNAVTSSYSFAWWDWKRWEKEIDWMALQGINMPLAFTGQEAIWRKVFQKFNISNSDLDDFFGGPAFLAWSRMGNLHKWGGPLPHSWFDQQLILQKKVIGRMFELGMTPVLPAFSGNIPAAFKQIYPSAKITRLGNWFAVHSDPRWCCTYLLDAMDPLFVEIGKAFIEQQQKGIFGPMLMKCTRTYFMPDTFDENTPPVDEVEYISSLGSAIFGGMQTGDSNAVWLMQGWMFSYDPFWRPQQMKALLHSVPLGRLVVLDLCMLHNFAGNVEMYGILDSIASGPIEARSSQYSTMVGVGMSMEGIEQNPVVYDLMSEMAFQHNKVDVKKWLPQYSVRRYGHLVPSIQDAWDILYHTIYNCTDGANDKNRDVIVAFPDVDPSSILVLPEGSDQHGILDSSMDGLQDATFDRPHLWYPTSKVISALKLFIVGGDQLFGSNTYRYDLVDLTRQALAKYSNELFFRIVKAYQLYDAQTMASLSQEFLELVNDIDTLLACHEGFLLGPWLQSAKQLAQSEEEEKQYEWNARTQITMWFDNTEEEASLLRDYGNDNSGPGLNSISIDCHLSSRLGNCTFKFDLFNLDPGNKYWSGLLGDYYGPRAAIYFKFLKESSKNGYRFPLSNWRREWIKLTNAWQSSRKIYPVESNGDALHTSHWLYNKYLQIPESSDQ
ncbi:alpha-N-acetylglucosaminidase-like [Cucumis melo var. makuwa]|uniref:Alpha-N-acetylglucosaminidase-like n=1 Tax=Cucumis melo var. makuwa TaxID=1194695 RepID=A0A5A7UWC6_CUCMM|nr:alpha-N-acetylglucosaminidase-like [Cucumis melo var. makuwa]